MSGGFFRGTSADQDTRFSNKQAKLMKSQKFHPELEHLVDMSKVKMDVMRPWIAHRVTELLGFEDEVLINFIYGLLEGKAVNGKTVQISLTGFMEKNTGKFMKELWTLLLSAQKNASGVPQQLLDAKEEETRKKKAETDRITNEIQKKKEKESREIEQEKLRKMDGEHDTSRASDAGMESISKHQSRASGARSMDEKEIHERNGSRGKDRVSRSPRSAERSPSSPRGTPSRSVSKSFSNSRSYSDGRNKSRSISRSPQSRGRRSISNESLSRSPPRRSVTPPRGRSPRRHLSPLRRRSSYSRQRSTSLRRRTSPSPARRRLHSPLRRRSRSPMRRRSRSPRRRSRSPFRRRSPSPMRRRSPSPLRRRSPSPLRRRSPYPPRRRSRSPLRRRSPSPLRRRSPSPLRRRLMSPARRRSPSPLQRRSPSPVRRRYRRSPSTPRHRSPSPVRRRSPYRGRRRSPSPWRRSPVPQELSSPSPIRHASPSPVRRRSPRRQRRSPVRAAERIRSPVEKRNRPSISLRSPQRSPGGRNHLRTDVPSLSPSPNRSPSNSNSPPGARGRSSGDDRSPNPLRTQRESMPLRDSSKASRGEKEADTRDHGDRKRRLLEEGFMPPSTADESRGSLERVHHKDQYSLEKSPGPRSREIHSRTEDLELRKTDQAMKSEKASRMVRHPEVTDQRDRQNHSHKNDVKDSDGHQKSAAVLKSTRNIDHNDRIGPLDSDSDEGDKRRVEVREKRKHKRSKRKEEGSHDDYSSDSQIEDRKGAKKRRKEEKRLKKEEKRQRREERRRRREQRRAEKLKLKSIHTASPPSDLEKVHDGDSSGGEDFTKKDLRGSDSEEPEPEQKKLEIELRKKALESLRAKKGVGY